MLKFFLLSNLILFMLGIILHFAYSFTNENKIIGVIAPVNESIFEHSKLLLTPITILGIILYFFIKDNINVNSYFFSLLIYIITSILTMISFYYTYNGVLGKEYLIVDMLSLLIALVVGQLFSYHIYTFVNSIPSWISIIGIIMIFILFIYWTYFPFKIPFFYDKKDKIYGIKNKYNE